MVEGNTSSKEHTTIPLKTCYHSTVPVCYDSYETLFRPGSREELCTEYFKKECRIVFSKKVETQAVRECHQPVDTLCGEGQGNITVCREVVDTVCTTHYDKTYLGNTACDKIPRTRCGATNCQETGEETCHDKTVAAVREVPEESCDLVPTKVCRGVYRTLPYLEPTQQCEDVPKEICNFGFKSAVSGAKPLTIKWCYDPHNEDIAKETLSNKDPPSFRDLKSSLLHINNFKGFQS